MTRMPESSFIFRRLLMIAACALLASVPAVAQTNGAQGWPESAESKPETRAARPAAVTVKPTTAASKSTAVTVKPTTAVTAKATTAVTVKPTTAVAKSATVAKPAGDSAAELLRRQTELMEQLAATLAEQRAIIAEQQRRLVALETRAPAALAPVVSPSAPPSAVPALPPAAPAPVIPPITVETGGIKLKMSGLFQGWYSATSGVTSDTFRLRRTELKFRGDMGARANWTLMVDAAKALSLSSTTTTIDGKQVLTSSSIGQSGKVLQDAFATVVLSRLVTVDVGQQKIPLSFVGTQSSAKLDTIERPLFASDRGRDGGYGDVRDLGVMVRGAVGSIEYYGGLFNGLGESQNDLDKNDVKDLVARIVVRPAPVKGLQVGGSFARDGFGALKATSRERHGVEFLYTRPTFSVKSEFMAGRDGAVRRRGAYVEATRRLRRNLQGVARFDSWDPDTRVDSAANDVIERDWLGGVTYTIVNSGVWLQINFVEKTFGHVLPSRHVFLANLQSTW